MVKMTFLNDRKVLVALLCFFFPWLANADDTSKIKYQANSEWKVVDTSNIYIQEKSVLDLSAMNDAPAGKYGRVIARPDGQLVFEKRPDKPLRFLGFNWLYGTGLVTADTEEEVRRRIKAFAELTRRQGYNIIRLHCIDTVMMIDAEKDGVIPPKALDQFDYMVKCFKDAGVYIYLDLAIQGYYKGGWSVAYEKDMRTKLYFNLEGTRANWRSGVVQLLNHQNRYTKTRVKDEPAVACLAFFNEQDNVTFPWGGYWHRPMIFEKEFHKFLKSKYGTIEKVKAAWKDPEVDKLTSIEDIVFVSSEKLPFGTRRNDISLFFYEAQRNLYAFYVSVMKEVGYKGLYSQWDATKNLRTSLVRESVPVISMHDYASHPTNSIHSGSRTNQKSTVVELAWFWRSMAQTRYLNKPMMITEYAQGFWNRYGHEAGIVTPAYSALQDYGAIMIHQDGVGLQVDMPLDEFRHWLNPIFRANEFVSAHLFRRGDVSPAENSVEVCFDEKYVLSDGRGEDAVNANQTCLAMVMGFGLNYKGKDYIQRGQMVLPPTAGAKIVATEYTHTMVDDTNGREFSFNDAITDLKRRKLIPAGNLSDSEKGIYQSTTGEITLLSEDRIIKVVTPKSEAVTIDPGQSVQLKQMNVKRTSVSASVTAISIDDQPLAKSDRIVLVYSTRVVNTGMELSEDLTTLYMRGELPILMQTGTVELTLANTGKFELWAIGLDGTRKERIPVETLDGKLIVKINTAALENGPTPFFELVRTQFLSSESHK
jgi:hypothetical protein